MVKPVAHGIFNKAEGRRGRQLVLRLANEFRVADEDRQQKARMAHDIFGRDVGALFLAGQLGKVAQALGDGRPETGLMCAAFGRRDRVAV